MTFEVTIPGEKRTKQSLGISSTEKTGCEEREKKEKGEEKSNG